MTKKQFLLELRDCLEDQVSERVIKRQLHYYDGFIKSQVSDGKKESQVVEELGDPKWIAKSIIDSDKASKTNKEETQTAPKKSGNGFISETKKWIIIAVLFLFILSIFSFLFLLLRFFVSLFIPIAIIIFMAWIIILFRKK